MENTHVQPKVHKKLKKRQEDNMFSEIAKPFQILYKESVTPNAKLMPNMDWMHLFIVYHEM